MRKDCQCHFVQILIAFARKILLPGVVCSLLFDCDFWFLFLVPTNEQSSHLMRRIDDEIRGRGRFDKQIDAQGSSRSTIDVQDQVRLHCRKEVRKEVEMLNLNSPRSPTRNLSCVGTSHYPHVVKTGNGSDPPGRRRVSGSNTISSARGKFR